VFSIYLYGEQQEHDSQAHLALMHSFRSQKSVVFILGNLIVSSLFTEVKETIKAAILWPTVRFDAFCYLPPPISRGKEKSLKSHLFTWQSHFFIDRHCQPISSHRRAPSTENGRQLFAQSSAWSWRDGCHQTTGWCGFNWHKMMTDDDGRKCCITALETN
jgi:hypothetical protein